MAEATWRDGGPRLSRMCSKVKKLRSRGAFWSTLGICEAAGEALDRFGAGLDGNLKSESVVF